MEGAGAVLDVSPNGVVLTFVNMSTTTLVFVAIQVGVLAVLVAGLYRLKVRTTRFNAVIETYEAMIDWLQARSANDLPWIELEGLSDDWKGRWEERNEMIDWLLASWGVTLKDEAKALGIKDV